MNTPLQPMRWEYDLLVIFAGQVMMLTSPLLRSTLVHSLGPSRGSSIICVNLGRSGVTMDAIISAGEAYALYAKHLGKTLEELTATEKRQAIAERIKMGAWNDHQK